MHHAHHVHLDRAVQTELLGDPGHLAGGEHDAEAQEHIVLEGEHPEKEQGGL